MVHKTSPHLVLMRDALHQRPQALEGLPVVAKQGVMDARGVIHQVAQRGGVGHKARGHLQSGTKHTHTHTQSVAVHGPALAKYMKMRTHVYPILKSVSTYLALPWLSQNRQVVFFMIHMVITVLLRPRVTRLNLD
jgi:hypothetical protein